MTKILLHSSDTYFVKAFSSYAGLNGNDLEFICFENREMALKYLEKNADDISAVLVEPDFTELPDNICVMYMSDRTSYTTDVPQINIHQSAGSILADIRGVVAMKTNARTINDQTRFVCVYSMQGGAGKSSVAYSLSVLAARNGIQVMYFNLEEIPSYSQCYKHSFNKEMDNLLYILQDGRNIEAEIMDTMERNEDSVVVMPPFHSREDLLSLTKEQLEILFNVISRKTDIRLVFLDLTACDSNLNSAVMSLSDTIVQVYSGDTSGIEKFRKARKENIPDLSLFSKKFVVMNKCRGEIVPEGSSVRIPYSESLNSGEMISRVLSINNKYAKSYEVLLNMIREG